MSKTKRYKGSSKRRTGPLLTKPLEIGTDQLTNDQRRATREFEDWFYARKGKADQIFRIGAPAGAGKSVLVKYLVDRYRFDMSNCYVLSYTGQAVNRLRADGVMASTIHSAIMHPTDEVVINPKTNRPYYKRGIPLTKVNFRPVKYLPSSTKLLIVDEASFLPEDLEEKLKRYEIPILEIGDPLQLGPVAGKQVFNMNNLNCYMTQVMRQAADSELLDFITRVRMGLNIDVRKYHNEVLFLRQQESPEATFVRFEPFIKSANVVITCTNRHRQTVNEMYRRRILKVDSPYPVAGERVICRRNNWSLNIDQYVLTNGTQGVCMNDVGRSMVDKGAGVFYMDFQPDVVAHTGQYYDNLPCDLEFLMQPVGSNRMVEYKRPGEKFEYAHALTAHAMQGAQAQTVLYMDSFHGDEEYLARIRYTAASRAEKRLIYLIPYSKYPGWFDMAHIEERRSKLYA